MTTDVVDLKAFVPAKDLAVTTKFYVDLGWQVAFKNDEIAELRLGAFGFLLQKFFVEQHAHNFMMSLMVDDADAWWRRIQELGLAERYPGIMLRAPAVQPWGLRVLFMSDPTGVLWHIVDRRTD